LIFLGDNIFLNENSTREDRIYAYNTLGHEWVHNNQLDELGVVLYVVGIAIPSILAIPSRFFGVYYYNQEWERITDFDAGIIRDLHCNYEALDRAIAFYNNLLMVRASQRAIMSFFNPFKSLRCFLHSFNNINFRSREEDKCMDK